MNKRNRIAHSFLLSAVAGSLYACGESTSFEVKEKPEAVPQLGSLDANAASNRDHVDDVFQSEADIVAVEASNEQPNANRVFINGTEMATDLCPSGTPLPS